jgi:hypothetical protein
VPVIVVPTGLTYATNPASYTAGTAITPNDPSMTQWGSPAPVFSVSPSLPTALGIDSSTGIISGTPTTPTAAADYTVKAQNPSDGYTTCVVNVAITLPDETLSHNVDACIDTPNVSASHSIDAYALSSGSIQSLAYVNLELDAIFPGDPANTVNLNIDGLAPGFGFVNLALTATPVTEDYVKLGLSASRQTEGYVKLGLTTFLCDLPTHSMDVLISLGNLSYVRLGILGVQGLQPGISLRFPDTSFVKLALWAVSSVPGQNSKQDPGKDIGIDFLSSQEALGVYRPISLISVNGINLIITSFIAGVTSYQTRTKQWMRRVDEAAGGIVISTEITTHTSPVGRTTTTTRQIKQVQDTTITTVTVQDEGMSTVTASVTETSKSGKEVKRQIQTNTENGIRHTIEKKVVSSQPPTRENLQPIRVRNLKGMEFYQWFGQPNEEWAGGEVEGTTTTETDTQIVPSSLNGATVDSFGNPILAKITDQTATKPTGEVIQTYTEVIGTQEAGTIVTDSESDFNGLQTTTVTTTRYPDGSSTVTTTVVDNLTGDSVETAIETATNEVGQVTITTTVAETKTFADPVTGQVRQTVTKTVTTVVDGVTTTDVTTVANNDFEDDIISDKIKVFLVQEFTITCIIDWMSMQSLEETFGTHQIGYARLELYGQQLGNANLSWPYRQRLISQYNGAMDSITPVPMQALGKTYNVVFAPSASSFRAKYITGTDPTVYELQMILQQRSDLTTGERGY